MHNFLDLVNTTSPQPDTSSHLNQSKATATKSAIFDIFGEVISTPGKEESSSYSEIFFDGRLTVVNRRRFIGVIGDLFRYRNDSN